MRRRTFHAVCVVGALGQSLRAADEAAAKAADKDRWGDLTATFVYDGEPPERRPLRVDKDRGLYKDPILDPSLVVDPKNKGIANVVGWLHMDRGASPPAIHPGYEKSAKDDAKKKNECIAKARKKFENLDGYRFEKDGEKWVWHTVRKQGAKLVSIHKIVVEIEEKDKIVILKPTGRDKGSKPWANPPKEVKFEVPNDYQITQDDPKQGKLVYEAKIGIPGDGSKPAR